MSQWTLRSNRVFSSGKGNVPLTSQSRNACHRGSLGPPLVAAGLSNGAAADLCRAGWTESEWLSMEGAVCFLQPLTPGFLGNSMI